LTPKSEETAPSQPQLVSDPQIYFQYVGATRLTLIGPRSGKRYRFDGPGAVVAIDPIDKRALAGVSIVRQVSKPADVAKEF
jgi:hypothetical protein